MGRPATSNVLRNRPKRKGRISRIAPATGSKNDNLKASPQSFAGCAPNSPDRLIESQPEPARYNFGFPDRRIPPIEEGYRLLFRRAASCEGARSLFDPQ